MSRDDLLSVNERAKNCIKKFSEHLWWKIWYKKKEDQGEEFRLSHLQTMILSVTETTMCMVKCSTPLVDWESNLLFQNFFHISSNDKTTKRFYIR